jgi:fatty acid desaturase
MLALAIVLHGPAPGAQAYALAFGLPALCAPLFMFFTNYLQHVGCDTGSKHDHSRNFVSPLANWFVFDAGYHTVHHERPNLHWSHYATLHREREGQIHPRLEERSVLSFCMTSYLLRPVSRAMQPRPRREIESGARVPH